MKKEMFEDRLMTDSYQRYFEEWKRECERLSGDRNISDEIKEKQKNKINRYTEYNLEYIGPVLSDIANLIFPEENYAFRIVKFQSPYYGCGLSNPPQAECEVAIIGKEQNLKAVYENRMPKDCLVIASTRNSLENLVSKFNENVSLATYNEGFYHPLLVMFSLGYRNLDGSPKRYYFYEIKGDFPEYIEDYILYATYCRLKNDLVDISREQLLRIKDEFLNGRIDKYQENKEPLYKKEARVWYDEPASSVTSFYGKVKRRNF